MLSPIAHHFFLREVDELVGVIQPKIQSKHDQAYDCPKDYVIKTDLIDFRLTDGAISRTANERTTLVPASSLALVMLKSGSYSCAVMKACIKTRQEQLTRKLIVVCGMLYSTMCIRLIQVLNDHLLHMRHDMTGT